MIKIKNFLHIIALILGRKTKTSYHEKNYIEELEFEKGFAEFFAAEIRPFVRDIENARFKKLRYAVLFSRVAIIFLILFLDAVYNFYPQLKIIWLQNLWALDVLIFTIGAVLAFMIFNVPLQCARKYRENMKHEIFRKIFHFLGFRYEAQGMNNERYHWQFDILPNYDIYESEDMVEGQYKGVRVMFEEITLRKKQSSCSSPDDSGVETIREVFDGFVLSFSANKNFKGKTVIKRDRGVVGNFITAKTQKSLKRINLEDPRFEKKFEVFSTDEIEARYLITTSFMERALDLSNLFGKAEFEAVFFQKEFFMAIKTKKDLFEPLSIFQETDLVLECKKVFLQMKIIFDIIDILKLDQDIGL